MNLCQSLFLQIISILLQVGLSELLEYTILPLELSSLSAEHIQTASHALDSRQMISSLLVLDVMVWLSFGTSSCDL